MEDLRRVHCAKSEGAIQAAAYWSAGERQTRKKRSRLTRYQPGRVACPDVLHICFGGKIVDARAKLVYQMRSERPRVVDYTVPQRKDIIAARVIQQRLAVDDRI